MTAPGTPQNLSGAMVGQAGSIDVRTATRGTADNQRFAGQVWSGAWIRLWNDSNCALNLTWRNSKQQRFIPGKWWEDFPIPFQEEFLDYNVAYQQPTGDTTLQLSSTLFAPGQVPANIGGAGPLAPF